LHEIKHDGFRVIARKEGKRVKLYSRPGNDLTYRFPLIVESSLDYGRAPASSTGRPSHAVRTGYPVKREAEEDWQRWPREARSSSSR